MLSVALEWVRNRLKNKRQHAEDAYVSSKKLRKTINCKHCGPELISNQFWGCKIFALGENSIEASRCNDVKSKFCPKFSTFKTSQEYREEFRKMSPAELAVRWPQINELIRVEEMLSKLHEQERES